MRCQSHFDGTTTGAPSIPKGGLLASLTDRILDYWLTTRDFVRLPNYTAFGTDDESGGALHLLEEICAAYDLHYFDTGERYAVVAYAIGLDRRRLHAARGVREWPTRSTANVLVAPLKDGERRVVILRRRALETG